MSGCFVPAKIMCLKMSSGMTCIHQLTWTWAVTLCRSLAGVSGTGRRQNDPAQVSPSRGGLSLENFASVSLTENTGVLLP